MRFVLVCAVLAGTLLAQENNSTMSVSRRRPVSSLTSEVSRAGIIRADVNRVLIPVSVTNSDGYPVHGLAKQDFRLLSDGAAQDVSDFFLDEAPTSIGVILDISNSMRQKIDPCRQAVSEFLRLASREDEFFLVAFKDEPELLQEFTTNPGDIDHVLEGVRTSGWTALYDAVYTATQHMRSASRSRRVLLVLTDGADNNSRYTESELRNIVRESDVRVFSVSIQGSSPAIERIAQESGGRAVRIRKLEEFPEVAVKLNAEIHDEYVLGFTPANRPMDGKYHTVRVELTQPADGSRLHATWRHGYYDPVP